MNSIIVIHPYKSEGVWVFDDPQAGLAREAFVSGADVILDRMVEGIPDAEQGVTLFFSANRFPGCQHSFEWRREEYDGNWYYSPQFDLEGWLCPALFKYFDNAPPKIWVQVKPKPA